MAVTFTVGKNMPPWFFRGGGPKTVPRKQEEDEYHTYIFGKSNRERSNDKSSTPERNRPRREEKEEAHLSSGSKLLF